MKLRRSERLVDMTTYLMDHPSTLIPLSFFSERYQSAKSSISEDLGIIKQTLELRGNGTVVTVPGAAGGVKYILGVSEEESNQIINELCTLMETPERLLPGGYLYMTDILGQPRMISNVGKLIASYYADKSIDVVMTVATKGIPLAYSVAHYLNVPVVIVRRDSLVTEGPTLSINYVSGSNKRIQTMVLSKKSLQKDSKVLIVDDFMKAGGTVNGMISLLEEFDANAAGIAVLVEAENAEERLVDEYLSLLKLTDVNMKEKTIRVNKGNFFRST